MLTSLMIAASIEIILFGIRMQSKIKATGLNAITLSFPTGGGQVSFEHDSAFEIERRLWLMAEKSHFPSGTIYLLRPP
jgi:hypothetical protein